MSKYRPSSLPKGSTSGQPEGGAVPAVRTREQVRAEWEAERQAEQQKAQAAEDQVEATADTDEHGEGRSDGSPASGETSGEGLSGDLPDGTSHGVEEAHGDDAGSELLLPGDDGDGLVQLPADRDQNGYVEIRPFTRPQSEDPKERLAHYARGIAQAEMAGRANEQRVKQQKMIVQGQNFLAIKEEKLWEVLGLPDFDALIKARFGFGKNYANKIIRAAPVVMALESVTSMELVEKHLRPLCPVLKSFGPDAVRQTWAEASRKKITEKTLQEAAAFLGFAEPVEQKPKTVVPSSRTSVADHDKAVQAVHAKEAIRSLRETDEPRAREAAIEFMKMAQELCEEFGIDLSEASG
ncbi:hypothetical protein [Streptomyces sp. NBC_01264]|uniref:hypothetical protein n=1 Tax=Streptomyces sp. NBC_01264 TaxID=2903804 RepID=UPI00225479C8|nr:hypothetical protein [Streptomyces sp. NBC_01264]MCX4784087.1 hypothetical protein [Streptomyces sp. NBC_01264]